MASPYRPLSVKGGGARENIVGGLHGERDGERAEEQNYPGPPGAARSGTRDMRGVP